MLRFSGKTNEKKSQAVIRASLAMAVALSMAFTMAPAAQASQKGTVNTSSLMLRQKADADSKALQTLPEGDTVEILATSGSWYKVTYGKFTGYVLKKYIKLTPLSDTEKSIRALGGAPGTLRKGDTGSEVKKLQKALKVFDAYDGPTDGSFGDLTEQAVKAFQRGHGLTADGVAGEDTIAELFGKEADDSTVVEDDMRGIYDLSDIGDAPATSKKGDSGGKVKKLQQALKLRGYYHGSIDSDFGEGTEAAVIAFQKAKGMSRDGVAGEATIRILFGEKAANAGDKTYKTIKLNWFEGGSTAIPKGATFTVKDVRTGKTFKCKRWSGYNHMDSEPLTKEDTAIMKGIYGGKWSWARRPILVLYNNKVYACSMNGMPHEDDSIPGNNFDGHFCIHFYMSKTHATNRVDEDHQACVAAAAKATW